MFSNIVLWFRTHATAILSTAIAVSKAGLLGKVAVTLGTALATVLGTT